MAFAALVAFASATNAEQKKPAVEGPAFVKLDTIVLPVYEGTKVTRQASIVLALELAKGKTEKDVEPYKRRLVDAFIEELTQIYDERQSADRVIDAPVIKERLGEAARRILGPGVVEDVLIQGAFERRRG